MPFFYYLEHINESAFTFRFIGLVSIAESLYWKIKGNRKRLRCFLLNNLNTEEKISLLSSFIFSKDYKFRRTKSFPLRHIMFNDFKNDRVFRSRHGLNNIKRDVRFCSKSLCHCSDWVRNNMKKVDIYIEILSNKLYEIRNAIIHESNLTLVLTDSGSLLDSHSLLKGPTYFRAYESDISKDAFIRIIKSGVKNFLLSNRI